MLIFVYMSEFSERTTPSSPVVGNHPKRMEFCFRHFIIFDLKWSLYRSISKCMMKRVANCTDINHFMNMKFIRNTHSLLYQWFNLSIQEQVNHKSSNQSRNQFVNWPFRLDRFVCASCIESCSCSCSLKFAFPFHLYDAQR